MSTYPVLNNRPIDQWKVTELKDELRKRRLPIKGLKDDLVKRLFEALQDEILDGGEETVGGTPRDGDLKEGETPSSADASVYQASMEQNVDEGPSEVATQEGDLVVSVTEASKESVVATTDISQEAAVATAEVSQKTLVAVAEVTEAPLVDVAAADEISLSDAAETKGDDLESVPSNSAIVKGVYPHAEGHSEIIAENSPEDSAINKMTVDDVPSDVASTDVKLDATSAKGEFGVGVDSEIRKQEAVPSPPDAITSHADPWDADAVATAPEQNAEGRLIPKNNSSDNALIYGKEHEDSKRTNGDYKSVLSGPKDQVSEVNPDLGSQIKCVSISHDSISTNEKNNVKGNLNADNSDLELEAKQEMVKPSSSIPSIGDDLQALDDEKELPKNETSLQEIDSITNMNLDKKEDSPDVGSPEKLNLDRSSGDESMEEDVIESKLVDSNIKSDDLRGKTEVTSEHVVKEVTLLDTVAEGSSLHTKEVVAEEKPATPTEKRKPEAPEIVANNESIKRQRRWNTDSVKIPEQQASKLSGSDAPKDVFRPALKRSFGRSDSTASGESPKERIVPPPQKPATTSLRIDRFVRPFTLKAVQELLGKTGSVCSFWMDHIKTHCYVTYPSVEEAVATRNAVYNLQWPPNNGNYLVAEFVDPQEVKLKLEPPPPSPAPISSSTATTPKAAPFQQPKANQTIPPHAAGTSRGLSPTPQPLTKLPPTSDPGPGREKLPPTPKNPEPSVVTLDDLFKKTQAYPRVYYMPLSEEEVSARLAARSKGKRGG